MKHIKKDIFNLINLYPDYVRHAILLGLKIKLKYVKLDDIIFDNLLLDFLTEFEKKQKEIEKREEYNNRLSDTFKLFRKMVLYRYDYYYFDSDTKIISIDKPITNIKQDNELFIIDTIGTDDKYLFDYEYLKENFKKILYSNDFTSKEREIIKDYILKDLDKFVLLKKYKISQFDLTIVLNLFRYKFAKYLLNDDFISEREFDILLNQNEGNIFQKNILINKICLDLDLQEISSILDKPLNYIKRAIFCCGAKFSLFDIQKLRKFYFLPYSLESLTEVV